MGDTSSDDDDDYLRVSASIAEVDPKLVGIDKGTPPSSPCNQPDPGGVEGNVPSKKCVSFSPKRQKKFVPHFTAYSSKQRHKLWYTEDEIDAIKSEANLKQQMDVLRRKQSKASLALAAAKASSVRFRYKQEHQQKENLNQKSHGQLNKPFSEQEQASRHQDGHASTKSPKQAPKRNQFAKELKKYLINMTDTYSKLGLGGSSFADTERYKDNGYNNTNVSKRRTRGGGGNLRRTRSPKPSRQRSFSHDGQKNRRKGERRDGRNANLQKSTASNECSDKDELSTLSAPEVEESVGDAGANEFNEFAEQHDNASVKKNRNGDGNLCRPQRMRSISF